jgi:flagellar biosynthesis GTPase FlhF
MMARIACVLLVALASVPALAPAAGSKPPPRPGVLWQQYPLGNKHLTETMATSSAPTRPATERGLGRASVPAAPNSSGAGTASGASGSSGLPIGSVALGTVAAVLVLAGLAALYVRSRRGARVDAEAALAGPLASITLAARRLEGRRRARGFENALPAWEKFNYKPRRRAAVTDKTEVPGEAQGARQSHTDVGDRVAGVIRAAEELAEHIRSDAHDEAAQIKRQAEESHAAAMRELAKEQEELRAAAKADAAEIQRTGENYATERRREAEAEATKLISEAEGQARAMREAAEQMAMQIESNALQRREKLEERTEVVETRLRRFQAGLAEISKDLGALLEPRREQTETLLEALDVDQRPNPRKVEEDGARTDSGR